MENPCMDMESELECKEKVSYNLYGTQFKCSYHGDSNLAEIDGLPYCVTCDGMAEEKKTSLPWGYPKIKKF